jgi:CheY-like chemotaxis protein
VVADDDADIRALVMLAVRKAGGTVSAAVEDGQAALDEIRSAPPALAILDVTMPELTGLQVCQALRADPQTAGVPVMLLSAAAHPEALEAGRAVGADEYATKPFSPRALADEIRRLLFPGGRS